MASSTSSSPTSRSTRSRSSTAPPARTPQPRGHRQPVQRRAGAGAVRLADLNGDGIPDLIVANSGGNNVLVYPGLGNGQFGSPINGTAGFPVGTDPTGLTVADLNGQPDLLVADTGSNDVSVLLGEGKGSSWTMIGGPRVQTDAGPVAMAVGNLLGDTQTDLAVANSGSNNVQVFPGVGGGFFNDQPRRSRPFLSARPRPRCSWAISTVSARAWPRSMPARTMGH